MQLDSTLLWEMLDKAEEEGRQTYSESDPRWGPVLRRIWIDGTEIENPSYDSDVELAFEEDERILSDRVSAFNYYYG